MDNWKKSKPHWVFVRFLWFLCLDFDFQWKTSLLTHWFLWFLEIKKKKFNKFEIWKNLNKIKTEPVFIISSIFSFIFKWDFWYSMKISVNMFFMFFRKVSDFTLICLLMSSVISLHESPYLMSSSKYWNQLENFKDNLSSSGFLNRKFTKSSSVKNLKDKMI